MSEPTFKDLEPGWTARAQAYDDWLAPVTRQAIEPILAALEASSPTGHYSLTALEP